MISLITVSLTKRWWKPIHHRQRWIHERP